MDPVLRPRVPAHRDVVGAAATWVFGLAGLGVSGLLTVLKFRAANLCDDSVLTTCGVGDGGCATALTDTWSTVLGLPITVYSAALYLVAAGLAVVILVGTPLARAAARLLLLALAWLALLVSAALLLRTLTALTICPYCLLLDIAALGLVVAAHLLNPRPLATLAALVPRRRDAAADPRTRALAADPRTRANAADPRAAAPQTRALAADLHHDAPRPALRARDLAFVAAVAAITGLGLVAAQHNLLRRAAAEVRDAELSPCMVRLRELADTPMLLHRAAQPRAVAALFLDLTCRHCRHEFAFWRDYAAELAASGAAVEIRVYHYPRTGCSQGDLVRGGADAGARRACDAARALTCLVPSGDPAKLVDATTRLFALQDAPTGLDSTALAAVARELGWSADPTRPPADDPFFGCMQAPATQALLRQHMRFAEDVARLERPPGMLWIPLHDGQPTGVARQFQGRKDRAVYDRLIAEVTR